MMIAISHVPRAFGRGITIPIPKGESTKGIHRIDSFRGITLSPVISKIFERCLLIIFREYFYSADNQFGFKSKVVCTHAIYVLRNVIDYYVSNDSTINLCFLDMSKAFDKINHKVLFLKLMKRNVPVELIKLLSYWYSIVNNSVRWGCALSKPYLMLSGVRQGGVLSPILFAVYVNDMLVKFQHYGCKMFGISVSALMYADDLVLLAPSITELQAMVCMLDIELAACDLKLNVSKSASLRVGKNYTSHCTELQTIDGSIEWVKEVKYLGIYLLSGRKYVCNFDKTKIKYYRAANSILGKFRFHDNTATTMHLISSIALPILTYALEALSLNKSQLASLEHTWSRTYMKVFVTFDNAIVRQCQYFIGTVSLSHLYTIRKMNFLLQMKNCENTVIRTIFHETASVEIETCAKRYNCLADLFSKHYVEIVHDQFRDEVVVSNV